MKIYSIQAFDKDGDLYDAVHLTASEEVAKFAWDNLKERGLVPVIKTHDVKTQGKNIKNLAEQWGITF